MKEIIILPIFPKKQQFSNSETKLGQLKVTGVSSEYHHSILNDRKLNTFLKTLNNSPYVFAIIVNIYVICICEYVQY